MDTGIQVTISSRETPEEGNFTDVMIIEPIDGDRPAITHLIEDELYYPELRGGETVELWVARCLRNLAEKLEYAAMVRHS